MPSLIYIHVQGAENNAYWNPIKETLADSDVECVRLFDEWVAQRVRNPRYFTRGADGEPVESMSDAELRWRQTHRYEMRDAPAPGVVSKVTMCGETWRNGRVVAPERCELTIEGTGVAVWYTGQGGLWGALDWADGRGYDTVPYRMLLAMLSAAEEQGEYPESPVARLEWRKVPFCHPPGFAWRLTTEPDALSLLGGAPCFSHALTGQIAYVVRERGCWRGAAEITPYESVKTAPRRDVERAKREVFALVANAFRGAGARVESV